MALTREEVLHIATLCRIALSPEDVERMRGQLSHILEQFQVLGELNTGGVPPTSHSVEMQTVLREDAPAPCLGKEKVLANAPQREGDYFKVKVVLEE